MSVPSYAPTFEPSMELVETHHSIFGSLPYLAPIPGHVSILIIVAAVIFTEYSFHVLHSLTHDTPFADMVTAIEKELMIVGCMALIFKVAVNTSNWLSQDWLEALEYADILVPITSFCLCAMGLGLILVSIRQCDIWCKAYHLHLFEILEMYFDKQHHFWSSSYISWLPFSIVNSEMEFRIFHSIFCEQYLIQRKAFAFDEYVHRSFEKFLLRIITIRPIDWFYVCIFTLLNWLRLEYLLDFHECERGNGGGGHGSGAETCHAVASLEDFTITGLALLLINLVMAVTSRFYELKLMGLRGIRSSADYAPYLQKSESREEKIKESRRFNEEELKQAVAEAKSSHEAEDGGDIRMLISDCRDTIRNCFTHPFKLIGGIFHHYCCRQSENHLNHVRRFHEDDDPLPTISSIGSGNKGTKAADKSSTRAMPGNMTKKSISIRNLTTTTNVSSPKASSATTVMFSSSSEVDEEVVHGKEEISHNLDHGTADLNVIFFLHRPALYFNTIETLIMPIAFYLAVWVTNMATVALRLHEAHNAIGLVDTDTLIWQLKSIAPGVLSALLYFYSVKVAALLRSVTELDHDAVEEIIEQTEGSRILGQEMRDKILSKLHALGDSEEQLKILFAEIDDNGSDLLSRYEFQVFLNALGITFSRKKWAQIFVEIDKNNDDEISFEELFLFLYPLHDEALLLEKKRLRKIGLRVKKKAEEEAARQEAISRKSSIATILGRTSASFISSKVVADNMGRMEQYESDGDNSVPISRVSSDDAGGEKGTKCRSNSLDLLPEMQQQNTRVMHDAIIEISEEDESSYFGTSTKSGKTNEWKNANR